MTNALYPKPATTTDIPDATRWRRPNSHPPAFAFLDRKKRKGYSHTGEAFTARSNALEAVLRATPADADVLFVLGKPPKQYGNAREWGALPLPDGWTVDGEHYFGDEPVWKFKRPDGRRFRIMLASGWGFGADADAAECCAALTQLDVAIADRFKGARLLDTPLGTGRSTWQGSIPYGVEWPVLPQSTQELIRSTSAQARIEFTSAAKKLEISGLLELDGKLMYAACARELGIGPAFVHEYNVNGSASQRDFGRRAGDLSFMPGRYYAQFVVPGNWAHVGLLGHFDGDRQIRTYPSQPGFVGEGWHDAAELLLAADNGWRFTVHEGITYERAEGTAGPLDRWVAALLKIEDGANNPLITRAVRMIIVKTIGGFAQRGHNVAKTMPKARSAEVPMMYAPRLIDDVWHWTEPGPVKRPDLSHPEWSSAVWGKARARIARSALDFDRSALLGIQLDALWIESADGVYEPQRTGVGWLRRKSFTSGPLPLPQSLDQMRSFRDGS